MSCLCQVIASSPVLADRSISLWRRFDWLKRGSRFTEDVWRRKSPSYRYTKHTGFEYSSCSGKTSKPSYLKQVFARFAWSKFFSQVLVFHNDAEWKDQSELVSRGWELSKTSPLVEFLNGMKYYQARKTVLDHISKHRESWKYYVWRSIFDELQGSSWTISFHRLGYKKVKALWF